MEPRIPVLDLSDEIKLLGDELTQAIQGVIQSGQFIMGPSVKNFEQQVAEYLGVKHAIGVNSGTDAIVMGLRALGVGPGDEVITTPFTFFATAEGISQTGATPVFVDIDPKTFNINPELIEEKITQKTKAILPVHLYGQSADMEPIMKLADACNLKVLEDVAQAFGASYKNKKVGTIGDVGAYSFFPSKNLGAFGDGGLIVTNDDAVAETASMLRVHGAKKKYHNELIGYNSRLDAIQAAILSVKLQHIDKFNQGRYEAAQRYNKMLNELEGVMIPCHADYSSHVYHQYTVRIMNGKRDAVKAKLAEKNISTMIYYPIPLHKLPIYKHFQCHVPETELACAEVLSFPIWPSISESTQVRVVEKIDRAIKT